MSPIIYCTKIYLHNHFNRVNIHTKFQSEYSESQSVTQLAEAVEFINQEKYERSKTLSTNILIYDTKQSDGEVPVKHSFFLSFVLSFFLSYFLTIYFHIFFRFFVLQKFILLRLLFSFFFRYFSWLAFICFYHSLVPQKKYFSFFFLSFFLSLQFSIIFHW